MSEYRKKTAAELTELCELRGLESTGTKMQLLARLVKLDAEDLAATKATIARIEAESRAAAPPTNDSREDNGEGSWQTAKRGAGRRRRGKKGQTQGAKPETTNIGSSGLYDVLGEPHQEEVDEPGQDIDAFVRQMLSGDTPEEPRVAQDSIKIDVNMTTASQIRPRISRQSRRLIRRIYEGSSSTAPVENIRKRFETFKQERVAKKEAKAAKKVRKLFEKWNAIFWLVVFALTLWMEYKHPGFFQRAMENLGAIFGQG